MNISSSQLISAMVHNHIAPCPCHSGAHTIHQQPTSAQILHHLENKPILPISSFLPTISNQNSFSFPSSSSRNYAETAFEMAASAIRFGPGCTSELGKDIVQMFSQENKPNLKALVITDPGILKLKALHQVEKALDQENISFKTYSITAVEPTDSSFKDAINFCSENNDYDIIVAVGGGSVMDTAKAANLYSCYPDDFLAYVNAPLGQGKIVPGKLKPLIALPTTAGTGSEATGVAIFDLVEAHAKTGIASRELKPTLALVDPENTHEMPYSVAVASGFDVLCHALESYTAKPYNTREHPGHPSKRPTYQGSNPIADVWSLSALNLLSLHFVPSCETGNPIDREKMAMAASLAAFGFGSAGVHLCHGLSYGISGNIPTSYIHPGYPLHQSLEDLPVQNHGFIPHGASVVMTAPSVFELTSDSDLLRHQKCAEILRSGRRSWQNKPELDVRIPLEDSGMFLAEEIRYLMERLQIPAGLSDLGFTESSISGLVDATIPQNRVLNIAPIQVTKNVIGGLFSSSM